MALALSSKFGERGNTSERPQRARQDRMSGWRENLSTGPSACDVEELPHLPSPTEMEGYVRLNRPVIMRRVALN